MFKLPKNKSLIFTSKQLKVFAATFLAVFFFASLQLSGFRISKITLPIPQKKDLFFDEILPKLELKQKLFELKTQENIIPLVSAGAEYESASAYAVIDYDTGEVYTSKNASEKLPIASITKLMTSVVALDLAKVTEKFKVSNRASKIIPTKIGVIPGEFLTLDELLQASLLTSANDAVEVIKEGINEKYKAQIFIKAMNEKARILEMNNSSFTNPQGFDHSNHYSSVFDIAKLTRYSIDNYPEIRFAAQKDYSLLAKNKFHKQYDLYNWNGLLGVYPGAMGVKIGYTEQAGRTTVVVAERNDKKLIAVVLGAPGIIERDMWAGQLLDFGFNKALGLTSVNITEEMLKEKYASWKYWN